MRIPFSIRQIIIPLFALTIVLVVASSVSACPNCKNSVAQESDAMSIAFAWSIGFMLTIPFAILSAWAISIRRYFLRIKARHVV